MELEHPGWDRLGDQAREAIESYDTGWAPVLGADAQAVGSG